MTAAGGNLTSPVLTTVEYLVFRVNEREIHQGQQSELSGKAPRGVMLDPFLQKLLGDTAAVEGLGEETSLFVPAFGVNRVVVE